MHLDWLADRWQPYVKAQDHKPGCHTADTNASG